MANVDFPSNPTVNQVFTSGNQTWVWDGVKWVVGGSSTAGSPYLPTTGGTMTGPLVAQVAGSKFDGIIGSVTPAPGSFTSLNGGPLAGLRNRIINGAFRIDQRGTISAGAIVVGSGYIIDHWAYSASTASKFSANAASGQMGTLGNGGWLSMVSQAATAPAAGDAYAILQAIEGLNCLDLAWGTAQAKPVTLSFDFYSSLTGTHSGSIVNKASNRSYVFTWNNPVANTWTPIAVTIPGDTAGTWAIDNTQGLVLRFNLGAGSTYIGAAGAWSGNNFLSATGAVQPCTVNASSFVIGNVQLEAGPVATPFELRPVGLELSLCQRYYQRYISGNNTFQASFPYAAAGQTGAYTWSFPAMRVAPSFNLIGSWTYVNATAGGATAVTDRSLLFYTTASAAGSCNSYLTSGNGFELVAEL